MPRPRSSKLPTRLYIGIVGHRVYFDLKAVNNQRATYEGAHCYMKDHNSDGELPESVTPTDVAGHVYAVRQSVLCNEDDELVCCLLRARCQEAKPGDREILAKAYKAGVFGEDEVLSEATKAIEGQEGKS